MTGIVTGIGIRAVLGGAIGKAASAGGSVLKWIGGLDVIHLLALGLAILLALDHIAFVMARRHSIKVEAQLVSAGNALDAARANETALKKAIANQNGAVAALGATSAKQQNIAVKASEAAQERARAAEATAERLRRLSRSSALKSAPAAPCEPSDTLKGQWK